MITQDTFSTIYDRLLQSTPPPLLPPSRSPFHTELTSLISALQVHPTLEAALHILNHDLPAAHFLVRHMQAPPAVEGMYLHAILHRVEGDCDNARAWYADVRDAKDENDGQSGSEEGKRLMDHVWGQESAPQGGWKDLIDGVQSLARSIKAQNKRDESLERRSLREIQAVVEWCRRKFGDGRWEDASAAWVRPSEKIREIGKNQVVGGEGWRKF